MISTAVKNLHSIAVEDYQLRRKLCLIGSRLGYYQCPCSFSILDIEIRPKSGIYELGIISFLNNPYSPKSSEEPGNRRGSILDLFKIWAHLIAQEDNPLQSFCRRVKRGNFTVQPI